MSGGTNRGAATRAARKPELKRPAVKLERLFLMSNEQSIRDEMKVLLDDHSHCYDSDCGMDFGCSCDAIDDYDNSAIEHAGHLADVLLASPVTRRIQAEAWGEGHAAGRDYQGDGWNSDAHDPEADNPYRKEQS